MELMKIQTSEEISCKLSQQIPEYVIQEREAGKGTTLSYVSGATVIDILNSTFGYLGWSFETLREWKEDSIPFFQKASKWFTPDESIATINDKGEKGALLSQNPVAWVKGRLTITVKDENGNIHCISKEAYGSKSIIGKQSEQEHIFKSAQTDALKKAASLLGIGTQLYRTTEEEQIYHEVLNRPVVWTNEVRSNSELWTNLEDVVGKMNIDLPTLNQYVEAYTDQQYIDIYTLPEAYMQEFIDYLASANEEEE